MTYCRGLGGVCSAIGDFLCPAPRVPYLPEGDEFCACCGEDSCLDGFDCIALDDPVCPDASVLLNQDGACTCACVAEGTCFAETENVCVTYYAYGLLNCDGATEPFRDENGFCACGCTATDTCVLEGSTDCIKTADFNCSNSAEDPVRADDGTCSCEIQCPLGTCFVVNFACINAGGSCNNNSAGFSGFLGRGADGLICDCCNPATSCIDEQTDVCILLSEFPCSSPSDVAFANGANKGYCTCPS
ncbi:hypothetical protein NDN08_005015 [Rhodosorus marinus]|uniref:Uncharacterized protein n=1 Tax=Rhodosorus marinus TaxID=101924 RepID=A0AAV8V0F4_9RHOD|nr:hypothetical protein NDN08_005015 [Rhodosorus marinus]